ncbi:hypothetical protein FSARC_5653 [Fusarium sarcochroum]|uniref:Fungal lipase-type domain-containing protein n=1 Tax=Fusarium sarcochroum TaxID=1208366 RepID=A0A8H4XA63_9HYPO|nr:hypothetical protein FSARC_5653 [Fusarium sarcochroum]
MIGSLNEKLRQLLQRLDQEASGYTNAQVNEDESIEWNPSQTDVQLISAALKCARGAYHLEDTIVDTSYCTFRHEQVLDSSITGTVKAITSTIVGPVTDPETESDLLPVLVIAIRGSANKMDHIVNANSRAKATENFIHPAFLSQPNLKAHSGFLNSAWALDSIVAEQVKKYVQSFKTESGEKPHILFTGHSAGGAVSQLLYLHHIADQTLSESARFSCVTFGAPPCVTTPVDLTLYQPTGRTLCINIINEFDVVTRADKPYILSLVDLARVNLNLPPKTYFFEDESDEEIVDAALEATRAEESKLAPKLTKKLVENLHIDDSKIWHLPRPFYHHVGSNVVLFMRLVEGQMSLKAAEVTPTEFRKLLFCRVAVHGKSRYGERVEALEQGRFNDRIGWESERSSKGKDS